jgi:hypothetical protein
MQLRLDALLTAGWAFRSPPERDDEDDDRRAEGEDEDEHSTLV